MAFAGTACSNEHWIFPVFLHRFESIHATMPDRSPSNAAVPFASRCKIMTVRATLKILAGIDLCIAACADALFRYGTDTPELRALRNSIIAQKKINSELHHVAAEVRTAILLLRRNDRDPRHDDAFMKEKDGLPDTPGSIGNSIRKIEQTRADLNRQTTWARHGY